MSWGMTQPNKKKGDGQKCKFRPLHAILQCVANFRHHPVCCLNNQKKFFCVLFSHDSSSTHFFDSHHTSHITHHPGSKLPHTTPHHTTPHHTIPHHTSPDQIRPRHTHANVSALSVPCCTGSCLSLLLWRERRRVQGKNMFTSSALTFAPCCACLIIVFLYMCTSSHSTTSWTSSMDPITRS